MAPLRLEVNALFHLNGWYAIFFARYTKYYYYD